MGVKTKTPAYPACSRYTRVMPIAITGAAGGIGSVLADHLLEQGHDLVLIDDLSTGSLLNFHHPENRDRLIRADVTEASLVSSLFSNCQWIIHLAGISSLAQCQMDPARAVAVNVGATAAIAELARRTGANVVFASTSAIYERNTELPHREDDDVDPVLVYPTSKLMAERLLRNAYTTSGIPSLILRFFNVFGPRQDFRRPGPPLVNYLVREAALGRNPIIYAPLTQSRDYVYVSDIVQLLSSVLIGDLAGSCQTVNVASGRLITVGDILDAVSRGLGREIVTEQSSPELLWERHIDLFAGSFPLRSRVVMEETLKQSLGSIEGCRQILGWEAATDVASKISEDTPGMIEEVLAAARRGEVA